MLISDDLKNNLKLNSNATISSDTFNKLITNAFSVLISNKEPHHTNSLYGSKPDLIKTVYSSLVTIAAEFGRHNCEVEYVETILKTECGFSPERAASFAQLYGINKQKLQINLGCIGTHLPHITDANWKIDYIVKTSELDQTEGPLFRISFVTHVNDSTNSSPKEERVNFSCNAQELQDLVYNLKDAVRHCQTVVLKH